MNLSDLTLMPFVIDNGSHHEQVAALWQQACGEAFAISPSFVDYARQPQGDERMAGMLAYDGGSPVGFVFASMLSTDVATSPPELGYIDAIAVMPEAARQGVGTRLLEWAESWLAAQGCNRSTLGASLSPFLPGVPTELGSEAFFSAQGYLVKGIPVWDVAADLNTYEPPPTVREIEGQVRPAQPRDYDDVLGFLQREFNGRWRYEFERYVARGGRIADYMVLWTACGVDGCCILTFEDSLHPIERYYPYQLPKAWGQLGSIGVSADRRGRGYGAALMDAGLRRLHNNGVNGCVIDWTTLLDFYGKFGFTPYREYVQMEKHF